MTREGGSIPVTLTLQEATGKNVMLLPLGACDDGAHSQNEKFDRKNYIEGVSIFSSIDVFRHMPSLYLCFFFGGGREIGYEIRLRRAGCHGKRRSRRLQEIEGCE